MSVKIKPFNFVNKFSSLLMIGLVMSQAIFTNANAESQRIGSRRPEKCTDFYNQYVLDLDGRIETSKDWEDLGSNYFFENLRIAKDELFIFGNGGTESPTIKTYRDVAIMKTEHSLGKKLSNQTSLEAWAEVTCKMELSDDSKAFEGVGTRRLIGNQEIEQIKIKDNKAAFHFTDDFGNNLRVVCSIESRSATYYYTESRYMPELDRERFPFKKHDLLYVMSQLPLFEGFICPVRPQEDSDLSEDIEVIAR